MKTAIYNPSVPVFFALAFSGWFCFFGDLATASRVEERGHLPIVFNHSTDEPTLEVLDSGQIAVISPEAFDSATTYRAAQQWAAIVQGGKIGLFKSGSKLAPPFHVFTGPPPLSSSPGHVFSWLNRSVMAPSVPSREKIDAATISGVETVDLFGSQNFNFRIITVVARGIRRLICPFGGVEFEDGNESLPETLEELVIYNSTIPERRVKEMAKLPCLRRLVLWGCNFDEFLTVQSLSGGFAKLEALSVFSCGPEVRKILREVELQSLRSLEYGMDPMDILRLSGHGRFPRLDRLAVYIECRSGAEDSNIARSRRLVALRLARELGGSRGLQFQCILVE